MDVDCISDPNIPQWKRELIKRLRSKNKWFSDSCDEQEQQLLAGTTSAEVGRTVQQPNLTCSSSAVAAAVVVPVASVSDVDSTNRCNENSMTMVKDRVIDCDLENNCLGVDEELHYGPGIVKKLKNHYLSLTLRECNAQVRPSILPLRKATSLENLLDDGDNNPTVKVSTHYSRYKPRFQNETRNFTNNRYNASRGVDLKRARSVEAISRTTDERHTEEPPNDPRLKHQSFHEEMLIAKEGNGVSENIHHDKNTITVSSKETPFSNTVNHKVNRPKRIAPLMSEKEKPPVDVVKQTKRIFEGKAEQRTKQPYHTGDVAAKVASYKSILQTRNHKKPPILKQKPTLSEEGRKSQLPPVQKPSTLLLENGWKREKSSPEIGLIPDVSLISSPREENNSAQLNLSETPDLILHSSPVKNVYSPGYRILATDSFLKAEIRHADHSWISTKNRNGCEKDESDGAKPESRKNTQKSGSQTPRTYLPIVNVKESHTRPTTIKNITHRKNLPEKKTDNFKVLSPILLSPLTLQEIEKNHINSTKTVSKVNAPILSVVPSENVNNMEAKKTINQVPKNSLLRKPQEQNSIVFKFTDRRDVPDYVYNDGKIRTGKIEKPKIGEGGIILLPGVSLDESFVDDGDDWMLILEGPPSPCDIEFVNGNILIDGRSSLSQKSKRSKMKIKFVESLPEIYEYPSEASFASDYIRSASPLKEASTVNTIHTPTMGTSLANYIPKLGQTEEFQLGITRSTLVTSLPLSKQNDINCQEGLQEVEEPVLLFSAETNSDILF